MKSRISCFSLAIVAALWFAGCGEISTPTAPSANMQVEDNNDLLEVVDISHQDDSVFPVDVLQSSPIQGAAKMRQGLGMTTDQTNRSILSITVTKDGQPVKNAMLYAMASVSGLGIYFPWSQGTGSNGQAIMAISAYGPVRGYFLIRAVDSVTGEILGQWSSLPINNKKMYVLDLRVGEIGSIVSVSPLTNNVPLLLIKNVGKSHVLAADGSEEFVGQYDVQAVNDKVLVSAALADISLGLTDVKMYATEVQVGATSLRYGANMFLMGTTLIIEKDSVVRITFRARLRNPDGSMPSPGTKLKVDWLAGNQNGLGIQSGIPVSTLPVSGTISVVASEDLLFRARARDFELTRSGYLTEVSLGGGNVTLGFAPGVLGPNVPYVRFVFVGADGGIINLVSDRIQGNRAYFSFEYTGTTTQILLGSIGVEVGKDSGEVSIYLPTSARKG